LQLKAVNRAPDRTGNAPRGDHQGQERSASDGSNREKHDVQKVIHRVKSNGGGGGGGGGAGSSPEPPGGGAATLELPPLARTRSKAASCSRVSEPLVEPSSKRAPCASRANSADKASRAAVIKRFSWAIKVSAGSPASSSVRAERARLTT
jgi:hypothetical protein